MSLSTLYVMKLLRQLFTQNIGLKIISLFLAFAFWRMITSENISEIGYLVPLELRNIPEGVEIVGDVVNSVNLRIRATSRLIKGLNNTDLVASVDLSHSVPGEHTYPLANANVQVPLGVEVVRVLPTHIKLRLEKTLGRSVPVKVRWRGSLPNGTDFSELAPVPSQIHIEGPESRVSEVTQLLTDVVDLGEVNPTQPFLVNISIDDPTIRLSREKVSVHVVPFSKASPPKKAS